MDLSLDDQLAFIANCAVIAGEALRDCDAKKRVLEEWFDAEGAAGSGQKRR